MGCSARTDAILTFADRREYLVFHPIKGRATSVLASPSTLPVLNSLTMSIPLRSLTTPTRPFRMRQHAFQPVVVVARLAQLLGDFGFHATALVTPAVERLLADLQQFGHSAMISPSPSSRSAPRSLLMTCSGVCFLPFMGSCLPSRANRNSRIRWTNVRGSAQWQRRRI
jgi:hypothetical protein